MSKGQHNFILPPYMPKTETILEQGSSVVMEDCLVQENGVFAVLDGATSLGSGSVDGKTGGQRAAEIGAQYLSTGRGPLSFRVQKANIALRKSMIASGVDFSRRENRWSASLAAIRLHKNRIEWTQLGDCRILFLYKDGRHKLAHCPEDHDRETLSLMAKLGGRDMAMADGAMQAQLLKVRRTANRCYGVLNGDPAVSAFLKSGFQSLEGISDILLFTDGLLLPGQEELAMSQTASLYRRGGLPLVHSSLRGLQAGDPQCITYPRFKMCDDISAVSLSL